mmetsp:Transcript_33317/g.78020  ORF Transcript_33317/g.78020 Transcript_33317/m.78020 type:complete len:226 (+) Transcript_33317:672-1349(+)
MGQGRLRSLTRFFSFSASPRACPSPATSGMSTTPTTPSSSSPPRRRFAVSSTTPRTPTFSLAGATMACCSFGTTERGRPPRSLRPSRSRTGTPFTTWPGCSPRRVPSAPPCPRTGSSSSGIFVSWASPLRACPCRWGSTEPPWGVSPSRTTPPRGPPTSSWARSRALCCSASASQSRPRTGSARSTLATTARSMRSRGTPFSPRTSSRWATGRRASGTTTCARRS